MWARESENNIMIVGHRGVRGRYPENTLCSFQAALDLELDLIEFDVRLTKDKKIVVCHDAEIDRTTDGKGRIADMTLEELRCYDAGVKKAKRFAGEKIPTLEEVLALVVKADYTVLLNVEIKDYEFALVDQTIAQLRSFGLDTRSVIACLNADVLLYTQRMYPEMKTQGFPERYMSIDEGHPIPPQLYENMYGIGIPITKESPEQMAADVAMAKQYNIKPWLFCADDEENTALAVKMGATNITCNMPYATIRYLTLRGLHKPLRNKKAMIAPSVMCLSEWQGAEETLHLLEVNGVELLHADVMDGVFVSNLMLGTESIRHLRRASSIPLDIHLMIDRPEEKLDWFDIQPGEYVSVHIESTRHLQKVLSRIRELGAHPMVALNPATPLCMIEEVLQDVDGVLLMTVNPGFAGQKMVPQTLEKISKLRRLLDETGRSDILIEVDGNVSFENGIAMRRAGADIFVGGTSSVFSKEGTITENIVNFRRRLEEV